MKKYLLLLAGLMILAPYGRADAKAVKLGRGNAYSVAADANVNTRAGGTQLRKGECEADTECPGDKKCMGYKCVDVCTQPTGNGIRYGRICGGRKCIADPVTPHAFMCVDSCYNVVCKSPGYTTEVSGDDCCCVAISCPSGQRLENGKCVANCTGVTCKSGYKTVSNSTGCCCEADASCPTGKWLCSQCGHIHEGASPPIKCPLCASSNFQCLPSCTSGYSYNTTYKGCIKDTLTCNIGCALKGCGIGSTLKPDTGYYIKSDGTCPACSTAIANCAACSISKLGDTPKCTKCNAGYSLSNGKCTIQTCPANCSTCDASGSCTKCNTAYLLSSGKCVSCPLNATCSGTSSFSCKSGYERYNNTCRTSSCNGTSSTPLWCQDTHVRVEGKGCCRIGYTANEMCFQCSVRDGVSIRDTSCSDCICGTGGTPYYNGTMCICKGTDRYGDFRCGLL